jgi:hypothetical protein
MPSQHPVVVDEMDGRTISSLIPPSFFRERIDGEWSRPPKLRARPTASGKADIQSNEIQIQISRRAGSEARLSLLLGSITIDQRKSIVEAWRSQVDAFPEPSLVAAPRLAKPWQQEEAATCVRMSCTMSQAPIAQLDLFVVSEIKVPSPSTLDKWIGCKVGHQNLTRQLLGDPRPIIRPWRSAYLGWRVRPRTHIRTRSSSLGE